MTLRLRPQAEKDIREISYYIAIENLDAAFRWHDDIYEHCHMLANMPGMGRCRNDLRTGLKIFPVGRYLILYRETKHGVDVVRVVHGARDLRNLL